MRARRWKTKRADAAATRGDDRPVPGYADGKPSAEDGDRAAEEKELTVTYGANRAGTKTTKWGWQLRARKSFGSVVGFIGVG